MSTQAAAPTTSTVLGEWLALLDREGVSARNRDAHRMGVERFAEYLRPRGPEEAAASDVRGFLAYLGELGVSEQSQSVYRLILDKWVMFAMRERQRSEAASAAAEALSCEPIGLPADEPLTEAQAESTWPFAMPRPAAPVPAGTFATAFEAQPGAAAPVAPLTIDFAAAPGSAVVSASAPVSAVAFAPVSVSSVVAEPELEPEPAPIVSVAFDDEPASTTMVFDAPVAVAFDHPVAVATEPPVAPAPEAPSAFGGFAFGEAPAAPTSAPAASAFAGFGSSSFGSFGAPPAQPEDSETTFMSPDPAEDADKTPARPFAAASADPPALVTPPPAASTRPVRDATTGDHVMGGDVASIPLGGSHAAKPVSKSAPTPVPADTAFEAKQKLQGWGMRTNGTERNDLDLTQIRNLAATGALGAMTLIRKPGGEWMKAGDYQPLRSVFQQGKLDASFGGPRPPMRPDPLAHPALMAWLGAGLGAAVGAVAWWVVAVCAGSEILPLALLVAALSGGVSAWLGRGESWTAIGASAVATLGAMVVGRAAVYQTMKSGVISASSQGVDPLAFLAQSATGHALTWWGIAVALAAVLGGVGVGLRKR
jgi:hypothetical protein